MAAWGVIPNKTGFRSSQTDVSNVILVACATDLAVKTSIYLEVGRGGSIYHITPGNNLILS